MRRFCPRRGFGSADAFLVVCVVVLTEGGEIEKAFGLIVSRFFGGSLSWPFLFDFAPALPGAVDVI